MIEKLDNYPEWKLLAYKKDDEKAEALYRHRKTEFWGLKPDGSPEEVSVSQCSFDTILDKVKELAEDSKTETKLNEFFENIEFGVLMKQEWLDQKAFSC